MVAWALIVKLFTGNSTEPHWWGTNIGSGNGLLQSDSKPLPETLLTEIYVSMSLGHIELSQVT